jgi:hypothetical protein
MLKNDLVVPDRVAICPAILTYYEKLVSLQLPDED